MEQDYKEKGRLWKVLNRSYIYRDAWLTARKDTVQLPNGNIIPNYYILEYPNWVNTIAITKDQKFIFIRQYRQASKKYAMNCVPACAILVTHLRSNQHDVNYGKKPATGMETGHRS